MSPLCALSIVTAVLCGIWSYLAGIAGLIGWAGFAGCTTYFACGKHGMSGVKKTMITNLTGVLCGMTIITLSKINPLFGNLGIWCGIITFVMCIIAKYEWFDFCPGTFMGCFTTFAADGNWSVLVVSLVIGAFSGFACEYGGNWLYQAVTEKKRCNTYVGEKGHSLSGGERQRIAIARAILKNAPIVILDEATAFTDPQNEDKIQKSIMALSKGKTLLVIAHRLSTIQNADQIVVLKKGRIVDCGKQEELLKRCPLYADMWKAHIGAKNWSVSEKKEVAAHV